VPDFDKACGNTKGFMSTLYDDLVGNSSDNSNDSQHKIVLFFGLFITIQMALIVYLSMKLMR